MKYKAEFQNARLIFYFVVAAFGIYIIFFDKFEYACNTPGNECIMCGMKTAVYYAIHFDFAQAKQYNSNVWIVLVLAMVAAIDTVKIIINRIIKSK